MDEGLPRGSDRILLHRIAVPGRAARKEEKAPEPLLPNCPLPPGSGDLNPDHFVVVHKEWISRLERVVAFTGQLASKAGVEFVTACSVAGVSSKEVEALWWGFPCRGCGCAESLCCCGDEAHRDDPAP